MKFNAQKSALTPALSAAKSVIASKPAIAIAGCFLLRLKGNDLEILANDVTGLGLRLQIEVDGLQNGEIAVSAQDLQETVSNAPDGNLSISVENLSLTVSWGEERDSNLQGYNSDDFIKIPKIETDSKVSLKVPSLDFLYAKVGFATSKSSENRPSLTGILLEAEENRLCSVGTDSHRLARIYLTPEEESEFNLTRAPIVPPRAILALLSAAKAAGDSEGVVQMEFSETHLKFETKNAMVVSKLLEGPYPSWRPVIPNSLPITIKFNTAEMLDILHRINVSADKTTHSARFSIDGSVLRASVAGSRNTREKIACSCEYPDGQYPLNLGVNANYLQEILKICGTEEAILLVNGEHSLCEVLPSIENKDVLFLLMLMRISE